MLAMPGAKAFDAIGAAASSPLMTRPSVGQWEVQVTDFAGRPHVPLQQVVGGASGSIGSDATLITAFAPMSPPAAASSHVPTPRQQVWQSFVQHRALLSAGNSHMLALACVDTSCGMNFLHLLSSASGRPLSPPLALTAPPFALSMRSSGSKVALLLVVTCDALVRVYDLSPTNINGKKLVVQASARHLLRQKFADASSSSHGSKHSGFGASPGTLLSAQLTSDGAPLLVLSNYSSFVFDSSLESWTLQTPSMHTTAFPAADMRSELTVHQRTAEQQQQHVSSLAPPSALQPPAAHPPLSALVSMAPRTRVLHTVAHLETALAASLSAGDAVAYRLALTSYVAKLVSFYPALPAASVKLEEVCSELKGPHSAAAVAHRQGAAAAAAAESAAALQPPRWQPFVLGQPKRALLKSLLPLLHTNPHLQSLTLQLQQALE
jgi:hypothetical protein